MAKPLVSEVEDPLHSLREYFDRSAQALDARRSELEEVRGLLDQIGVPGPGAPSVDGVEVIPPELEPAVVSRALRETTGLMRNYVMVVDDGPAFNDTTMRDNQDRIAAGHPQWTLYPSQILESPAALQWTRSWASIGEVQRIMPFPQTEFAVFGDQVVITLATWGDPTSGYALIRHPLLVAAFAAFFDGVWALAHPIPARREDARSQERLIDLLGMGLKDEAIARVMNIGLRTVRRRVAALMAAQGVDTRFQLGVALASRPGGMPSTTGLSRPAFGSASLSGTDRGRGPVVR